MCILDFVLELQRRGSDFTETGIENFQQLFDEDCHALTVQKHSLFQLCIVIACLQLGMNVKCLLEQELIIHLEIPCTMRLVTISNNLHEDMNTDSTLYS